MDPACSHTLLMVSSLASDSVPSAIQLVILPGSCLLDTVAPLASQPVRLSVNPPSQPSPVCRVWDAGRRLISRKVITHLSLENLVSLFQKFKLKPPQFHR
jgi:hypothetical protein